ncbi:hypothetical protein J5N97_029780 [Dioscorea zingiberensis]|uniref:Agenet domain-containing protein n=1 Tax=Dioscorea zingiberensis TaxID=325984 RepID=A0A9D5H3I7_9LILI|nr:hypothetical protein J5N97_029780 [Dioscorea zingiberensis]
MSLRIAIGFGAWDTPMDYDDNDFQSQNFQLVGEDNNRFPSSLQPFSLPKLDLDDHFDVHLRFDPLVETECFLGIQGQENNWIENFSSGSSALDFTSSAAESCSISRHNNVWSEATSSESVEMLLKSVGGDEMINNGSIIKEVGRDQLTGLKGCTDTYYNMDDIIKIDPALPPDKCPKSLSGINDGSITVQSQVDALAQTSEGEKSGVDMDAGSIGERSSSDRESGAEQCTNDRKGTASSDDAPLECVAVAGDFFETAQIENSTDGGLLEKTADDDHVCVAKIDSETPDPDTCSAQANTDALSSGNLMASGKEMEKEGDIPVTKNDSLKFIKKNDSLKHKYGDANLNDELSERCAADSTLGGVKSSSCSEASPDPSVLLIKRCSESTFPGDPDELLEAIVHPVKTCNKDGDSGDDTVTRTVQMPDFAMEGGRNIEIHSVETSNEENADRSCRTELEDVRQDLQESYPKDNSCSENIVCTENVKPADEHGMEVKLETAMEAAEENHDTEIVEIKDNNISAEAGKQHSSNEQRHGSVGPEVKNVDSLLTRHLDSVLLKVASTDGEKCAADGTFETEDTADLPQTVLSDKSSSATLVNDTDSAMLSSPSHKSIGMYSEDKLAVEPCDIQATVHQCSVPECTQPSIHSGSISADSNASIVLGKANLIPAAIQDNAMLEVVNDSLTNNMVQNVTENRETESPLQQNEKLVNFSESSCSALSNAEAQMLEKPVSDPVAMVGLPVEEIIHVQSVASLPAAGVYSTFLKKETNNCKSHSEETHVIDVVSEPKQIISSIPTSDMVQVDKEDVTCMMILKVDANPQVATSQTPVDHSGRSSPGRCESEQANKANETSVDAEQHSLESRAENLSSYGPDCVSPATFSCIEVSKDITEQHKGNKDLSDRTGSVRDDQPCISSDTRKSLCSAEPVHNDSKEKNASEDDRNLSVEVGSVGVLSDKSHDESRPPARKPPQFSQTATKNSRESHFESELGEVNDTCTKTIHEDGRQASSGFTEITTTADRKTTEETPPLKQTTAKDDKQCSTSMITVVTMSSDIHSEMRQYPSSLFYQPFTDLQQVQLRAQIFVYGSLIQGTPPDEACMVSAFGETDGGRGSWEGLLCVAVERFQNQKSPLSGCETPLHSRSGVRIPEQVTRCNSLQSKSHNPPVTKFAPSAVFSSSSFPTPLWSTSARDSLQASMPRGTHLDFNQALSPLHSYQSSQMRHYSGNGLSWFPPNYPASVVVPSQCSRLDATPQYSAVPVAVTVQVTPTRDSSASRTSMQLGTASALLPSPGSSASMATIVPIEVHRKATTSVNNQNPLPVQKSRKRKKATVSEELEPVLLASQTRSESATVTPVPKCIAFSPVQPSSSNSPTKVISSGPVVTTSRIISPTHYQIIGGGNTEQSAILSEETHSRIEQAKVQAEDAAALASTAVRHSQGIWSQLALQKNSGLASEGEEKFASAAVAAAAAAAVAKAAAAAAKVASDAALQAKMMADEALDLVKTGNNSKSSDAGSHVGRKLTMLSPVSILKGKDKFHGSSSVISAAREASRRRVEAASAATKRAENLDAILKAAELTAEAVAQAGIIVAMGDPLPVKLSELAEAGPDNYFKVHCSASGRSIKTSGQIVSEQLDVDFSGNQDTSSKKVNDWPSNHNEVQKISAGDGKSSLGNGLGNALSSDPTIIYERDHSASISLENSISKDSLVEVVPDDDRHRGAWFSAHVLELKDGKAYVCYKDLHDEGSSQRKEWIPLEVDGNKAPRIRIPHPMATINPEGTKKRRRDAVGKYEWSVGDHVDAWRLDGWWEGIITEKSKEDETKLTVHFPAGGETSIFKAWNLRPSLVWKDGQWTLWARLRDITSQPYEGDTPFEKRPKLSRFEANAKSEVVDGRGNEETRPMILSAKERIFSAGKNVRGGKSSDPLRMTRTGHEKEGSRVVFGIPKPGKKRKFMDVSQHYVADKTNKISEGNDSIKLAKFFVPQESRLLSTSKTDARGKRAVNSRPKWPRPVKSQTIQTAGTAEKENSSVSNASASSGGEFGQDLTLNPRASFNNEQNQLEKKNTLEAGSSFRTLGPASCSSLEFSVQSVPGVPTSKISSAAVADTGVKGKLMAVVEKSIRHEEKGFEHPGKAMPESIEPRRSNRRIQPTSRLLEGLQSSLIISKIPSVSHDKGSRALHRGGSSSRGNPHG